MAFELAPDKTLEDVPGETGIDAPDFNGRLPDEEPASTLKIIDRYYTLTPALEHAASQPEIIPLDAESLHESFSARLSFGGLSRFLIAARELPSTVSQKLSANVVSRLSTVGEKLTLAEHKTARKRVAVAALGGLAIAAAAYTAHKAGISFGASHSHETLQQNLPVKTPHHNAVETIQSRSAPAAPVHAPTHHTAPARHHHVVRRAAAHVKYHTEALKFRGDTVWNHVQARVQARYGHLSQAKLTELTAKFTNKTLSLNHLTSVAARHMSLYQKFKISL